MRIICLLIFATVAFAASPDLEKARDAQDRKALAGLTQQYGAAAQKAPNNPDALYNAAAAYSYAAEVATEVRDKSDAKNNAEAGIKAAENAVALAGNNAEYHRILGTLCGQVIPANLLLAMKYGRCALDEVNRSIQLDGKSAMAYVSRGIGNYYLPASFGGGIDPAIRDFQKAISMDPKLAEAHLWLGVALRKAGRNAEARKAMEDAVKLNPRRVWAKQQLEKTPAK